MGTTLDSPSMQAFLHEFAAVLKKWNLTNILGLYSIDESSVDGPQTMEITEGRSNTTKWMLIRICIYMKVPPSMLCGNSTRRPARVLVSAKMPARAYRM